MTKKTPLQQLQQMRDVNNKFGGDPEMAHSRADQILCSLVREYVPNGRDIVAEYREIDKWYA